mmetsp:Transcript_18374/g.38535  ORF Transcript_18374/g.38535 Transcript_18374/m.38535 type:complete len:120 (-) Transcript_18374:126-485(-)
MHYYFSGCWARGAQSSTNFVLDVKKTPQRVVEMMTLLTTKMRRMSILPPAIGWPRRPRWQRYRRASFFLFFLKINWLSKRVNEMKLYVTTAMPQLNKYENDANNVDAAKRRRGQDKLAF